jgi:hypothetical protein
MSAHPAAMASPLRSSCLAPEEVLAASIPANTAKHKGFRATRAGRAESRERSTVWFDIQVHLLPPTGPFLLR